MKYIILLVIFLSSCTSYDAIRKSGNELTETQAQELKSRILKQNLSSLRGIAKTTTIAGGKKFTNRQIFQYHSSNFRLDILPLNTAYVLSTIVIRPEKEYLILPSDKKILESEDHDLFEKETGIPLEIELFSKILFGFIPDKLLNQLNVSSTSDQTFVLQNYEHYFEVTSNGELLEYQYRLDNKLVLEIQYSDYQRFSPKKVPGSMKLILPKKSVEIQVVNQQIDINPDLAERIFNPIVPADYLVKEY